MHQWKSFHQVSMSVDFSLFFFLSLSHNLDFFSFNLFILTLLYTWQGCLGGKIIEQQSLFMIRTYIFVPWLLHELDEQVLHVRMNEE